jgi:Cu(I)/Ag(I) efflux system membrane protein CusA/SilA
MVATITREVGANEIASENGRLRSYVQANVQDRDLGGFVNEVEAALKKMNWGNMTYQMTGEYENQRRFVQTMQIVFPIVLLIIFVMLYMVYHSAARGRARVARGAVRVERRRVLQKLLGYNFNGAVWVGYIALFGTAVQTGVVMVVYLEETVKKRMADAARLQLQPICSSREGRRAPAPASQGDDGRHHRGEPAAHHVESPPGRGSDEAAGHAGDHRRHGSAA